MKIEDIFSLSFLMFFIVRVLVNLKVQTMFLYQSNGSSFRINKALKDALCAPGLRCVKPVSDTRV